MNEDYEKKIRNIRSELRDVKKDLTITNKYLQLIHNDLHIGLNLRNIMTDEYYSYHYHDCYNENIIDQEPIRKRKNTLETAENINERDLAIKEIEGGKSKKILIIGEAGVGKSVHFNSAIYIWWSFWKKIVLTLDLSKLRKKVPLKTALFMQNFKEVTSFNEKDIDEILKSDKDQETILFVDGWDNSNYIPDELLNIVYGRKNQYNSIKLVVWSRTWKVNNLFNNFDSIFEIIGFSNEGVLQYFRQLLDKGKYILLQQQLNGKLLELCKIPLLAHFIGLLYNYGEDRILGIEDEFTIFERVEELVKTELKDNLLLLNIAHKAIFDNELVDFPIIVSPDSFEILSENNRNPTNSSYGSEGNLFSLRSFLEYLAVKKEICLNQSVIQTNCKIKDLKLELREKFRDIQKGKISIFKACNKNFKLYNFNNHLRDLIEKVNKYEYSINNITVGEIWKKSVQHMTHEKLNITFLKLDLNTEEISLKDVILMLQNFSNIQEFHLTNGSIKNESENEKDWEKNFGYEKNNSLLMFSCCNCSINPGSIRHILNYLAYHPYLKHIKIYPKEKSSKKYNFLLNLKFYNFTYYFFLNRNQ